MKSSLFYEKKPALGLDIGNGSIKVVQLEKPKSKKDRHLVLGYGYTTFEAAAINDSGVVIDFDEVARATYQLLTDTVIGGLTTDRVVAALPVSRTFTRVMQLPDVGESTLQDAVKLEAEQYVPMPLEDLYFDYEITYQDKSNPDSGTEVLMVAAPKIVVDSYYKLLGLVGLEINQLETSLISSVRAVQSFQEHQLEQELTESNTTGATLLIDFGAKSSDLSIFDSTIRVTGTVQHGGDSITRAIAEKMDITERQAHTLKTRYGIKDSSKHQKDIMGATRKILAETLKEINKMLRYYKSRAAGGGEIQQIQLLGGGANMPGLAEYIQTETNVNTSICDPWSAVNFGKLQEPHQSEIAMYTTAVGLALAGVNND